MPDTSLPAAATGPSAETMEAVLARVAALVPGMAARAVALDRDPAFPAEDFAALRAAGALRVGLPVSGGASGAEAAAGLGELLRLVGRGSLAVGRLFEGHVNALTLVGLYGSAEQRDRVAGEAAQGHLFGLWNTEAAPGLSLADGVLRGAKTFCSGAGHVTRALVTAATPEGTRMVVVALAPGERVLDAGPGMQGMRAARTASMDLDGLRVSTQAVVGAPGDYLRQPVFSAGAWRTSAVTLGGLEALLAAAREQLTQRGRDGSPHQLARMGEAVIAQESARMWVARAGRIAEGWHVGNAPGEGDPHGQASCPEDVSGVVNLARIAVERACLEAMGLVTRSLGLQAMLAGNPVERILRDLGTYLRQPAPDETLTEAAGWFMVREVPR